SLRSTSVPSAALVTKRPSTVATTTGAGQQSSPSESTRTTRSEGCTARNGVGARRAARGAVLGDDVTPAVVEGACVRLGTAVSVEFCLGERSATLGGDKRTRVAVLPDNAVILERVRAAGREMAPGVAIDFALGSGVPTEP